MDMDILMGMAMDTNLIMDGIQNMITIITMDTIIMDLDTTIMDQDMITANGSTVWGTTKGIMNMVTMGRIIITIMTIMGMNTITSTAILNIMAIISLTGITGMVAIMGK